MRAAQLAYQLAACWVLLPIAAVVLLSSGVWHQVGVLLLVPASGLTMLFVFRFANQDKRMERRAAEWRALRSAAGASIGQREF